MARWAGDVWRCSDELADPRQLLRVVQLRRDLSLPPDRRRAGRPLNPRDLHGRPLVADRGGSRGRHRPLRAARRPWPSATATTSRAHRGRGSCTSTRGPPRSSAPRSRGSSPAGLAGTPNATSRGPGRKTSFSPSDRSRSTSTTHGAASGCGSATVSASGSATATAAMRRSPASFPVMSEQARSSSRTSSSSTTAGSHSATAASAATAPGSTTRGSCRRRSSLDAPTVMERLLPRQSPP